MALKLGRNAFPAGHSESDFEAFGPAATKDGKFEGTYLADMGCFMQEAVDSNKYYHGGVYKSKIDGSWYFYVEYGRVGADNPQKQFIRCSSQDEAQREYVKQLESKNVQRGVWESHPSLGQRLVPKTDKNGKAKDLYLVRAQATRSTGLPAAREIRTADGPVVAKAVATTTGSKVKKIDTDADTIKLMSDLNVATVAYTKGQMADDAIPTQSGIDQGRAIMQEARKCIVRIGSVLDDQVNDKELNQLTRDLYSLIPKKKNRGAAASTWILSAQNIDEWSLDLDAFESALKSGDAVEVRSDPFGGMSIKMHALGQQTTEGEFIRSWMIGATRNVHGHRSMKIKNVWFVERSGDVDRLDAAQKEIIDSKQRTTERPLHQPKDRPDLSRDDKKKFLQSNTNLMFHGTRSVNVSGILRESLRLPNQLVGVVTNGAMFGPGLYWADDWGKSANYCSTSGGLYSRGGGAVSGRGSFMFVADVALGKCHVASGASGFTKAPAGHHSVFGKAGHTSSWGSSSLMNNEFIVYKDTQNRLRYLVEFEI